MLFRQAQELLQLNMDENEPALLRPSRNAALPETVNEIFDLEALRQTGSYEELFAGACVFLCQNGGKGLSPAAAAKALRAGVEAAVRGQRLPRRIRSRHGQML